MYKLIASSFVLATALLSSAAYAAPACSVDVESNDAMQFNLKEITVSKACQEFTVNLKHVGKLAKNVMGHNLVVTKASDLSGVATEGMAAGVDKDYLKPADTRVIAATKMIGGGESASTKFSTANLSKTESYSFFCSFPGHFSIMKGTLKVTD